MKALAARNRNPFSGVRMTRARAQVGQCTPSIMCAGRGFRQAAAGVVNIYAIDMHAGAMGLCTGALPQG